MISTFNEKGWSQACLIILVLIIIITWLCTFEFKQLDTEIMLDSNEYQIKLQEYNEQYSSYLKQLEKYNIDMNIYNKENDALKDMFKSNVKEISHRIFSCKIKSQSYPIRDDSKINRGKHDLKFRDILNDYFPDKITMDLLLEDKSSSFMPDIIFIDKETSLHIDIEIDEPYMLSSNKPIHVTDQDHYRDELFLYYNWVIIRFTEKQVINQAKECCELIQSVLNHIFSDTKIINNVHKENQWNYEEALIMAKNNYRRTYFKNDRFFLS